MEHGAGCCALDGHREGSAKTHKEDCERGRRRGEGSPDWLRGSPDEWRKASRGVNEQEVMNGREGMEVLHRAESKDRPEWGRLKDAASVEWERGRRNEAESELSCTK